MRVLVGFILGVVLTYLVGSFVHWSFDPILWGQMGRTYIAIMGAPISIVGAAFGLDSSRKGD